MLQAAYAELQVTSNYSFLRGASRPDELVLTAAALGHRAIAITDRNTLAGVVRAHVAAKRAGIRLVVGARLDLEDAPSLLCFPKDRAAYGRLSRLLTLGKGRAPKGECRLTLADLLAHGEGQILVVLPPEEADAAFKTALVNLRNHFKKRLYLAVSHLYRGDDAQRMARLADLSRETAVPLVATNDVHAHTAARRPLQDVLSCIREHCTLREAGLRLAAHAERHLKSAEEMARLFRDYPQAVSRTAEIAAACTFCLDELKYDYPIDPVPGGGTPQEELTRLAWEGAAEHFPEGLTGKIRGQLEHELDLIGQLNYAPYFLTVHDIVRFARSRDILCQGRGSAANSAVCYCLGITAVDPRRVDLLFERFISAERDEPPDIDVDFEHERREEVIQYIYGKYGRDRSGMTATVISYRSKSAVREVGKVMGLSEDSIIALQRVAWRRSWDEIGAEDIRETGLDPNDRTIRMVMALAEELTGFPRHLSQHTGGMVMTKGPLSEVVPIANAAMEDRTVIEWDKDDLDSLGILKVDVLALGMLTCIRKAFDLLERHHGRKMTLADVPPGDKTVYDMLCDGDSVGVFQVESRAQMAMLPRLRPRNFYDLVIEVAIVRPGPIQGNMVHPYLRRRQGLEPVSYPSQELEAVLSKTKGVPLFQEQAMQIAIVGAGFTPSEADALRRAMATFRRFGEIHLFRTRFIDGMMKRGYARDFAERCFKQIEGFADYGFPESHAASFALLVYVSAWLKRHYPAAFACALLNSQPMGFYAPAQVVRDATDHGVEVRPADINLSDWDHTLEDGDETGRAALRLGLRQIKGLSQNEAEAILEARGEGYGGIGEIRRRASAGPAVLETLARADALNSLGLARRPGLWAARGQEETPLPLFAVAGIEETHREPEVKLPEMALGESVHEDYRALRLSLKAHPAGLLRDALLRQGFVPCARLRDMAQGRPVRVAGLTTARQRPGSAKGVIFITLEDEGGIGNVIVHNPVFEAFRRTTLSAGLMGVQGKVQREGKVIHVVAERLFDLTPMLGALEGDAVLAPHSGRLPRGRRTAQLVKSRDFH